VQPSFRTRGLRRAKEKSFLAFTRYLAGFADSLRGKFENDPDYTDVTGQLKQKETKGAEIRLGSAERRGDLSAESKALINMNS
jgi:hypothetical protein